MSDEPFALTDAQMREAIGLLASKDFAVEVDRRFTTINLTEHGARKALKWAVDTINAVTEPDRTFRAFTRDLERVCTTTGLPYSDKARDLLLDYDIKRKPGLPPKVQPPAPSEH